MEKYYMNGNTGEVTESRKIAHGWYDDGDPVMVCRSKQIRFGWMEFGLRTERREKHGFAQ